MNAEASSNKDYLVPPFAIRPSSEHPEWAHVMTKDGFFTICTARTEHAHLFAAAPELLAALIELDEATKCIAGPRIEAASSAARAAIDKATGGKA